MCTSVCLNQTSLIFQRGIFSSNWSLLLLLNYFISFMTFVFSCSFFFGLLLMLILGIILLNYECLGFSQWSSFLFLFISACGKKYVNQKSTDVNNHGKWYCEIFTWNRWGKFQFTASYKVVRVFNILTNLAEFQTPFAWCF